jgi:hypothetical protein
MPQKRLGTSTALPVSLLMRGLRGADMGAVGGGGGLEQPRGWGTCRIAPAVGPACCMLLVMLLWAALASSAMEDSFWQHIEDDRSTRHSVYTIESMRLMKLNKGFVRDGTAFTFELPLTSRLHRQPQGVARKRPSMQYAIQDHDTLSTQHRDRIQ